MAATYRTYLELTKPGIIKGNAMTAIAGFLFASAGSFNAISFVSMLVGTSLVIAAACVFNNYIDRDIDQKMDRTKKRGLASGEVSGRSAIIFASILLVVGIVVLAVGTNWLTLALGLLGFIFYVVVYGIAKRRTTLSTIIGSVSGAIPVTAGYTAASGHLNLDAGILFLIMVIWQMPHFYAIGIYRLGDYAAAKLPILPVKHGVKVTKRHIVGYIVAFIIAASSLAIVGSAGYVYLVVMLVLGNAWLILAARGFHTHDSSLWAIKVFRFSLLVLVGFSVAISVNHYLI